MRRRRPAHETRADILQAAQLRLRQSGPTALRLDDVAADVGISRQAVLHHFGSRDGLLRAVVEGAWTGLFGDLATLVAAQGEAEPQDFVELVDDVARKRGNARLGAWLLLSEQGLPDSLFEGVDLASDSPAEDRFDLLLVGAALFGDAVFGARLRQVLGLADGEEERAAFRTWLVERLGR